MAESWSTACRDWERRIVAGESLIPPPLYPAEADAALAVFDELRVVDVPGRPRMADCCRPWTRDFVASIFGALDPETGRRRISEWLLLISKKNSKSTTAAGIMLTALLQNWRENAEYLILAPTVEVAKNSYEPAAAMVRADPELSALLDVQDYVRTITHRTTGATLKVVAADSATVGGKKATGVLVDELWLFGKRADAEAMLREATGGMASRPEGFVIYLTTQSDDPPAGVFREKLQYARDVRDGVIDDPYFVPVLYEFPAAMVKAGEHRRAENMHVTNPNLGASVSRDFLERGLQQAERVGEASLRGFLAKHLNVEIGLALRSDRWAGADWWERCAAPDLTTLDAVLSRSVVATVGIDGGGLDDLLGLCVLGRDAGGRWLSWCHAWAHESVLERHKVEASRMHDLIRCGDLTLVDRLGQDCDEVAAIVARVSSASILAAKGVGLDPSGIGSIVDALEAEGIPQEQMVGISQGWRLTGAIKTAERKLAEGAWRHGGQPLMAWCVGNARIEPRGNAVLITKQASGSGKIDALMATLNAVSLMQIAAPPTVVVPRIISLTL